MSEAIVHPSITVIESNNRFKVAATFSPLLVNYLNGSVFRPFLGDRANKPSVN